MYSVFVYRRSEMKQWWKDSSINIVDIDGKEYALSGWNDDAWYDCWECVGDDFTEASDENYTIKPIYNAKHEIIDYEIV